MDQETLLLRKYQSLKNKDLSDHHDLLDCSNYIYQIFLDSPPLFDQVNQNYKVNLLFKFPPFNPDIVINGQNFRQIATLAVLGCSQPPTHYKSLTRQEFFKAPAFRYRGEDKSVKDLIDLYRNTKGGVHTQPKGKNKDEKLKIKELSELLKVNDRKIEGYDAIMKKVVLSVVEALETFARHIESQKYPL